MAGGEQAQRCAEAAEEEDEGESEGRTRNTSSAAEESSSSSAGTVSSRSRAEEEALDGSAIGGGREKGATQSGSQDWDLVLCGRCYLVWFHREQSPTAHRPPTENDGLI